MEDPTMTELLRRAMALMLDKLNEHNPKTGYLFAIAHGLIEYLTMLTLAHARAMETIKQLEENHHARHTGSN